ncbi:MAG: hypothetical protein CVU95_06650 [Firmicutes bacterium HGW-Firmicutes-2]|nr:MAG: hypothetical protein CVU95_06650 [Firmicutes bacterium HGW-Firmicutes-2]
MTKLRNLFAMLFGVIIIPTLILMSINYDQTKTFIEDEAKLNNHQIVKQAKVATDSIISQTERISEQVAIDRSIQQFMYEPIDSNNYDDYQIMDDVYNVMTNFMVGTQYIQEISIYKLENDLLISTAETQQPAVNIKTEEYIQKLSDASPMKVWIEPNASGVYWEQLSDFQYIRFMYTNVDELVGFVVIKLKSNDFNRLINEMYIKKDGMLFIADQTGKLILSADNRYRNIVDLHITYDWFKANENYKKIEIEGQEYFISLVTSDYNNWKYISLIDTFEIQSKLKIISNNTILLLGFFLMASLMLSYAMSKGIYNPIHLIKASLEGNTKKIHEYNFYRLLKGEDVDENELVGEQIHHPMKYQIVLIEFLREIQDTLNTDYDYVSCDFTDEECTTLRNTFHEHIKTYITNDRLIEFFYETKTRIVLLLRSEDEKRTDDSKTIHIFETLIESYKPITNCQGTVVIGADTSFNGIKDSYEHLNKILKYKLEKKQMGIIEEKKFIYKAELKKLPYDYHTYLNNSLRASSLDACKAIIIELEEVVKSEFYYASNFSFYYKDVLNTIIGYLYEIQYIRPKDMSDVIQSFSEFDKRFKSINEATKWTLQFITNIFTFLKEDGYNDFNNPVNKCIQFIEAEFMHDISLNEVADRLDISVSYLSKQFKDETGINFKEYVTLTKIKKAKHLLNETNQTIEQIAKAIGYNSTLQMIRMFKKLENVTPSEYRKRS